MTDDAPTAEVIDLLDTQTLRRVVGDSNAAAAARVFHLLTEAARDDFDSLVGWLVREQIRRSKRMARKTEAKDAAIEAARLRKEGRGR